MNIKIDVKNAKGDVETFLVRRSYLVKFVDADKYYTVPYTISQDGNKNYEQSSVLGSDLTENQIALLFSMELL